MKPTGKQAIVISGSVRGECDHVLTGVITLIMKRDRGERSESAQGEGSGFRGVY